MDIVFAVGRTTKDAEIKSTSSGKTIVKFAIACDRKDKKVAFYNCDFWGERAGKLASYIKKGTWVSVVLKPEFYTGTDGKDYTSYQVLDFGFAGSASKGNEEPQSENRDESDDFADVINETFGGRTGLGGTPNYDKHGSSYVPEDDVIPFD